jgi:outer membrane protein TolC
MAVLVFMVGCAVTPKPLSPEEISQINAEDNTIIKHLTPVISGALTLDQAVERALKYNLDHRVAIFERALAEGDLAVSRFDMMPKVLSEAGYAWRDNDYARTGLDGTVSVSSDTSNRTTDTTFYWSLLDFGMGYYNAQESADRVLISKERRRRVTLNLIQSVKSAFWRAAAAQRLSERVAATIKAADQALESSRRVSSSHIKSPGNALRYQRALLENLRLLESVNAELVSARSQLAGLIGAEPGSHVKLIFPDDYQPTKLNVPVSRLEEFALINNPDLRISHYQSRIAVTETHKALLSMLPNLSFDYGVNYDDDSYIINDSWLDAGFKASYNLMGILSYPQRSKQAKLGVDLAKAKRMAIQVGVLTQLHLSLQEHKSAYKQYSRASEIFIVEDKLAQLSANLEKSHMTSRLDRISSDVNAILSEVKLFNAIADVAESNVRIRTTIGGRWQDMDASYPQAQKLANETTKPMKSVEAVKSTSLNNTNKSVNKRGIKPGMWAQIGAYKQQSNAELNRIEFEKQLNSDKPSSIKDSHAVIVLHKNLYRVLVGPFKQKDSSPQASALAKLVGHDVVVKEIRRKL